MAKSELFQPIAIPLSPAKLQLQREDRQKKKEVICSTHDKIHDAAERIIEYDLQNASISDIPKMQDEIVELGNYIIELVEYAKERGQAMEDRLSEYSAAISELGFARKKRG